MNTATLHIEMEKNIVPQLRFQEFNGTWEMNKLGPYLKLYLERVPATTDIPILTSSRNGLFKQSEYFNNREVINTGEYGVVPMGYFTYRHMSDDSTFKFNINTKWEKGAVSKEYPVFTTVNMDKIFLYHKLNYGNELKKFAIAQKLGSTRVRLYFKKLKELTLFIPTLTEQQKISSFLCVVDEKILQLSRKKELLEQYKKGVMQQLFSGKLRFRDKNGEHFVDWEEKKLGDLAKITTGKLDANAMVQDGEYRFYTCAKDYFRIDKYAFDTEALLISGNGANVGYIHYYKGKFNAYQRTYVLDRIKENIIYLKFYLDNFLYERIHTEKKEGNTPYIVMSTLSEMEILLPSLPEQQKIANFLSSIDAKIESTNQHINQTQSFKKGLLQQMFV